MSINVWITLLTAHLDTLRAARRRDTENGSVTLEQVIIAAGLLAAAVGVVAVIVAVVDKYASKIS